MTAQWKGKKISVLKNNHLINLRNWIKKHDYSVTVVSVIGPLGVIESFSVDEDDECLLDLYAEVCNEIFNRLKDGRLCFEDLRGRL